MVLQKWSEKDEVDMAGLCYQNGLNVRNHALHLHGCPKLDGEEATHVTRREGRYREMWVEIAVAEAGRLAWRRKVRSSILH